MINWPKPEIHLVLGLDLKLDKTTCAIWSCTIMMERFFAALIQVHVESYRPTKMNLML